MLHKISFKNIYLYLYYIKAKQGAQQGDLLSACFTVEYILYLPGKNTGYKNKRTIRRPRLWLISKHYCYFLDGLGKEQVFPKLANNIRITLFFVVVVS